MKSSSLSFIVVITILMFMIFCVSDLHAQQQQQTLEDVRQILLSFVPILTTPPRGSSQLGSSSSSKPSSSSSPSLPYCLLNWKNTTLNPCDFTGVFCNANRTAVISIMLTTNVRAGGLGAYLVTCPDEVDGVRYPYCQGTLPQQLEDIESLEEISFTGNVNMNVPLYPSWGPKMKNLRSLELINCPVAATSPLPSEWADVDPMDGRGMSTNLEILNLVSSKVRGSLPSNWSRFSKLVYLNLGLNLLTGSIPESWGYGMLNLRFFAVLINDLSGPVPQSIENMQKLHYLTIASNRFTFIPTWKKMPALEYFLAAVNHVTTLPDFSHIGSQIKQIIISANRIRSTLPGNWSTLTSLQQIDLSRNFITDDHLPEEWGSLTKMIALDLSRNNISATHVPISWAQNWEIVELIDLSLNCVSLYSADDNYTADDSFDKMEAFSKLKYLTTLDLTPSCTTILPINTSVQLAGQYVFRRSNPFGLARPGQCTKCTQHAPAAGIFPGSLDRVFELILFCVGKNTEITYDTTLDFSDSCVSGFFTPTLHCYENKEMTYPCRGKPQNSNSDSNNNNNNDGSASCASGDTQWSYKLPIPAWQNQSQIFPYLASGAFVFTGAREAAQLLFDAYYFVKFEINLNWINGTKTTLYEQSDVFQSPKCDELTSFAIPFTTSCAPCPNFGKCYGNSIVRLKGKPAWRPENDLLPFQECLKQYSAGCLAGSSGSPASSSSNTNDNNNDDDDDNNNNVQNVDEDGVSYDDLKYDGAHCKKGYMGPFCAKCDKNYGRVGSSLTCAECPGTHAEVLLFAIGLGVLIIVITIFVYISVSPRKSSKTKGKNSASSSNNKPSASAVSEALETSSETTTAIDDENSVNGENDENDESTAAMNSRQSDLTSSLLASDTATDINFNSDGGLVEQELDEDATCWQRFKVKFTRIFVAPVVVLLEKFRPQLERLLVALRQIVNHLSLIGSLTQALAAQQLATSVQGLFQAQQSATTFAFGSYAASVSCMFPDVTSSSVLTFDLLWAVFGCVFIAESIIFFAWFRRGTVTAAVALFLSFFAYSSLSENSTKILALCKQFHFYDERSFLINSNLNPDCAVKSYNLLTTDIEQDCDDPGFLKYRIGAAFTFIFFSVGLPVFIVYVHRHLTNRATTVVAATGGDQQQEGSENNTTTKEQKRQTKKNMKTRDEILSFLTKHYKESVWYWEVIVMVRKTTVACIFSIFSGYSALQLELYTAMCGILLVLSVTLQPLDSKNANYVDQLSISSAAICTVLMSLASSFPDSSGVTVTIAVLIFITQIIAIGSIFVVLFFDCSEDSKSMMKNDSSAGTCDTKAKEKSTASLASTAGETEMKPSEIVFESEK